MLQEFLTYFKLGFSHITDWAGYDHMLFVIGLCAVFRIADLRKIGWLITAFTVGHCLTLLLAGRYGNLLPASLTEQFVALTIFLSGVYNLSFSPEWHRSNHWPAYTLATLFGLIHGLAFSNFFRALGSEPEAIWKELLAFNLGVEAGQLFIVFWYFLLYMQLRLMVIRVVGDEEKADQQFHYYWSRMISLTVLALGAWMFFERL